MAITALTGNVEHTTTDPTESAASVRVHPKRTLLASGLLSFVLMSAPLFTALYLLGTPIGTWPAIVYVQLVTMLISLVCLLRYLTAFAAVEDGTLLYRSFTSPLVRIPLSRVDTTVIVETYRWNAPDSVPQLLLLDAHGRRVDRMRGTFWREQDMRAIAAAVGRPISDFPEPITMHEFFRVYPTARYWFENRIVATGGLVLAFAAALITVPSLMAFAGIPLFRG